MRKSTGILLSVTGFLAGVITGFLFAPVKKGLHIGCNAGNSNCNYTCYESDDSCCGCEDDDMEDDEWLSSGEGVDDKDDLAF